MFIPSNMLCRFLSFPKSFTKSSCISWLHQRLKDENIIIKLIITVIKKYCNNKEYINFIFTLRCNEHQIRWKEMRSIILCLYLLMDGWQKTDPPSMDYPKLMNYADGMKTIERTTTYILVFHISCFFLSTQPLGIGH